DLLDAVIELALGREPPIAVRDTGVRSAAVKLLLPERAGRVAAVRGVDAVSELPNVVDLSLKPLVGTQVEPPSMNAYLGHVVAVDRVGHGARAQAEWAAGQIELVFGEEAEPALREAQGDKSQVSGEGGAVDDAPTVLEHVVAGLEV